MNIYIHIARNIYMYTDFDLSLFIKKYMKKGRTFHQYGV